MRSTAGETAAADEQAPDGAVSMSVPQDREDARFKGRDFILGVDDAITEEVHVPEWQTWVRVKAMSGAERDAYEQDILVGKGRNRDVNLVNARAKLIARSVVDQNGERMFAEGDVKKLGAKSAAAIQRVYDVASRLSGLSESDMDELVDDFTPGQS